MLGEMQGWKSIRGTRSGRFPYEILYLRVRKDSTLEGACGVQIYIYIYTATDCIVGASSWCTSRRELLQL